MLNVCIKTVILYVKLMSTFPSNSSISLQRESMLALEGSKREEFSDLVKGAI